MLRREPLAEFLADAEPLMYMHWLELCVDPAKLKMDLDTERYLKLEQLNVLYVLAARRARKLLGYMMAFVLPHFHYKSSGEIAATDMYWVQPEERNGVGLKLFARWERDMRARGVVQMVTSCKLSQDHTEFLKKLGWMHTDNTLCKFL